MKQKLSCKVGGSECPSCNHSSQYTSHVWVKTKKANEIKKVYCCKISPWAGILKGVSGK